MRFGMRAFVVVLSVRLAVLAQESSVPPSQMQRAIDEFKTQTAALGLRADASTANRRAPHPLRDWHGRLYENLRNDFLDAIPHEIRQLGGDKSLLRRNQYGFNIAGPFFIPRLVPPNHSTYVSLSYEAMHEGITRTYL